MIRLIKRTLFLFLLFALIAPALTRGQIEATAAAARSDSNPDASPQYAMDWRITGPTGGDVRALEVDPSDPQRFYFGTLDGQLYTSMDGGQQWRLLFNFNRPKLVLDHIIVDPRDSKTIYVAGHRHKDPGGFFKTTDGGLTWRESTQLKGEALHSMTQSKSNPDVLVVGTNRTVFRSTDSGESWTAVSPFGTTAIESLAIDPRNTDTIYAGTWYLPYKSNDGGRTWNIIKTGMIDDSDVFSINIDPRNPDHVIASACSGIYDTRNGGATWRKVQGIPSQSRRTRAILQHPSIPGIVYAGTTEGLWRSTNGGDSWMLTTSKQLEINSIVVHPKNPQTIYIGTNNYGVMVSNDGGKNFAPSNGGYSGRFANSILADREKAGRIYATTINTATGGGFFFVSNDGGVTWQPSMRNMPNRLISYSILQDERDPNMIYLGTNLGVYRSLDRGASWSALGAPKPAPAPKPKGRGRRGRAAASSGRDTSSSSSAASASAARGDDMVKRAQEALNAAGYNVGTPDGNAGTRTVTALRKFQTDKGIDVTGTLDDATLTALGLAGGVQTSTAAGKLPQPPMFLTDAVNALALTHDERNGRPGMLAATNAGLLRSYDPAQGWERLPFSTGLDTRTLCISTSAQNPNTIWVGTATSGVLVSRDSGATWEQVSGIPASAPVSAIEEDQTRASYIYVGTKQTFYYSHDGGQSWTRRGGNLPYGDYASILINPHDGNEIFAGSAYENGGGLYRSVDAGVTWLRVDPQDSRLPSQRFWALAFDPRSANRLFVGSHSAGIYIAERGVGASFGGGN
ncbi:MAG TPA: peptidoglycan-binding protein [Pyrinomonadaceae bacterium]